MSDLRSSLRPGLILLLNLDLVVGRTNRRGGEGVNSVFLVSKKLPVFKKELEMNERLSNLVS